MTDNFKHGAIAMSERMDRLYARNKEMLTERAELEAKVRMLEDENAKLKAAVERLIERHALLLAQVLDE